MFVVRIAVAVLLLSGAIARADCPDGVANGTEECDDGNTLACDGCAATCRLEPLEEEPNGTPAASSQSLAPNGCLAGQLGSADDEDWYTLTLDAAASLRIETFDGRGQGKCKDLDTVLGLFQENGASEIATDDDGGLHRCSRIDAVASPAVRDLAPGTYRIRVRRGAVGSAGGYSLLVVRTNPDAFCGGEAATIVGSEDDDVLAGSGKADRVAGRGGNDVLRGRGGDDVLCGGAGADLLKGGLGDDRLRGGADADRLRGGHGDDGLRGGGGNDDLRDFKGSNSLNGGNGIDVCVGGAGDAIVNCETASVATPTQTPTVTPTLAPSATPTITPTLTPAPTVTPNPALCGNGIEDPGEECDSAVQYCAGSCLGDCRCDSPGCAGDCQEEEVVCGDGNCSPFEEFDCCEDCGGCQVPVCGNGICEPEFGETCIDCQDCGLC